MATFQTQSAVGIREDLSDVIYNISPTDTPFMSTVGKTKATAVYHEWQKDVLAAVNLSNAAVDGAVVPVGAERLFPPAGYRGLASDHRGHAVHLVCRNVRAPAGPGGRVAGPRPGA